MAKKGILLINIGSPKSYEVSDVKSYLKKFLMDKWIIDLPYPLRWVLVNLIILPKRSPFSAGNYKKVWMPDGSPLIVYSKAFKSKLQSALGDDYIVQTGMCFSDPNIEDSLLELKNQNVEIILAVPMFPQFAGATTGGVSEILQSLVKKYSLKVPFKIQPPFYKETCFIENSARIARDFLKGKKVDHYLFSYHGLPEKQIRKNGCPIDDKCCFSANACTKNCYRAQCLENSRLLANALGLSKNQWSIAFQSRLGRAKWIGPSTDDTLKALGQNEKKNIAVLCPSFVADCIETLEEIAIGAREDFIHAGGEQLHLVPCLNADSRWANDFALLLQSHIRSENATGN